MKGMIGGWTKILSSSSGGDSLFALGRSNSRYPRKKERYEMIHWAG